MTFVFLRVRVEGMCIPRYSRLYFDFCSFADAADTHLNYFPRIKVNVGLGGGGGGVRAQLLL